MSSSISKRVGRTHPLPPSVSVLRFRGWRGSLITPHRAFGRLHIGPREVIESVLLAGVGLVGWVKSLPAVGRFWAYILSFWGTRLGFKESVVLVPQGWGNHIRFSLPCFSLSAGAPSGSTWWGTAIVTVLVFVASFLLTEEGLPWAYLMRGFCLLQATALAYFAFAAARFPHDLPGYTVSMLVFGCILIGLVPVMYGFTFYPLNFSLTKKIFLTIVTMGHLLLFLPNQYMLHVYLLHGSVLFMPVLYFLFGPFLDIVVFIGFYSWGMSWGAPDSFEI